jgi:hypothetical protein
MVRSPRPLIGPTCRLSTPNPPKIQEKNAEVGSSVLAMALPPIGPGDAGLMQIEWSEGEVLKLAGVGTEAERGGPEGVAARIDDGKRSDRGREVGTGSGAGRTGAERGEPCKVCELWARRFMRQ